MMAITPTWQLTYWNSHVTLICLRTIEYICTNAYEAKRCYGLANANMLLIKLTFLASSITTSTSLNQNQTETFLISFNV